MRRAFRLAWYILYFFGDHEGSAVVPSQQCVGFVITLDRLGLGVEFEGSSHNIVGFLELKPVLLQVFLHPFEILGCFLVVAKSVGFLVKTLFLSQLIGNVGQVAKTARNMTFVYVSIQVFGLSAADRMDEVFEYVSLASIGQRTPDSFQVITFRRFLRCVLVEVGLVGDPHVRFAGQAPNVENKKGLPVIEDGQLGVGGFTLILVPEPAAYADDALGPEGARDHPTGDVHLVHPLVSDVPVPIFPKPVPIVVNEVFVEVFFLSRSGPDVEIERGGRLFGVLEPD